MSAGQQTSEGDRHSTTLRPQRYCVCNLGLRPIGTKNRRRPTGKRGCFCYRNERASPPGAYTVDGVANHILRCLTGSILRCLTGIFMIQTVSPASCLLGLLWFAPSLIPLVWLGQPLPCSRAPLHSQHTAILPPPGAAVWPIFSDRKTFVEKPLCHPERQRREAAARKIQLRFRA